MTKKCFKHQKRYQSDRKDNESGSHLNIQKMFLTPKIFQKIFENFHTVCSHGCGQKSSFKHQKRYHSDGLEIRSEATATS